jgi:hypothetical protein
MLDAAPIERVWIAPYRRPIQTIISLVIIWRQLNRLTVCCSADIILKNILRLKIPLFYSKILHIEHYGDSSNRTRSDTFDTCLTCPD